MLPVGFIGFGILLIAAIFQYIFFNATLKTLEQDAHEMSCQRLTQSNLYGPEDMTVSALHNVIFISSHNRREFATEGAILMLRTDTDEIIRLPADYPDKFHPHGIALFEDADTATSRLFVISHLMATIHDDGNHSIEIFDYDHEHKLLRHVESLTHDLIVHPNGMSSSICADQSRGQSSHHTHHRIVVCTCACRSARAEQGRAAGVQ
jgi:hypothetical protein